MNPTFAITKTVRTNMAETEEKLRGLLMEQGFGVLTEIDVQATLKKRIDVDTKPYKILGACNPPFAHEALAIDENVGLVMPCNITLSDNGDGSVTVQAFDPEAGIKLLGNPALDDLAKDAGGKIHHVMEQL